MEIQRLPIGEIKAAKYNPRKDLKPGDPEFEKLKNSIERWDLVEPLVVNKRTGTLISGHQRLKVCRVLGITTVEAVVVDLSPKHEKLLNMSLNKTGSDWDYVKLEELFKEFDISELGITGFDDDEVKRIADMLDTIPDDSLIGSSRKRFSDEDDDEAVSEQNAAFTVYVTFGSKEAGDRWLEAEGFDKRFGDKDTVNICMRGIDDED